MRRRTALKTILAALTLVGSICCGAALFAVVLPCLVLFVCFIGMGCMIEFVLDLAMWAVGELFYDDC